MECLARAFWLRCESFFHLVPLSTFIDDLHVLTLPISLPYTGLKLPVLNLTSRCG
jgi:hypothetical protein